MTSISAERAETAQPAAKQQAARRARAQLGDRIATGALWGVGSFIGLVFAFVVVYTVSRGIPAIAALGWFKFLTSGDVATGIGPQLLNTFYLLFLSLIPMLIIGGGAAIYMVEYARQGRFVATLRFATETLTSMPSIIAGLIGALIFVTKFGSGSFFGLSRISAALTLALLNMPWMLRSFEDALRSVPRDLREASLALGATPFKTVWRTVLPAAVPGIVTGVLVVSGRVIGESAALIFTSGSNTSLNGWQNLNLNVPGENLALHIYTIFSEGTGPTVLNVQLATSMLLIVLVLILNVSARILGNVLNKRLTGK